MSKARIANKQHEQTRNEGSRESEGGAPAKDGPAEAHAVVLTLKLSFTW